MDTYPSDAGDSCPPVTESLKASRADHGGGGAGGYADRESGHRRPFPSGAPASPVK